MHKHKKLKHYCNNEAENKPVKRYFNIFKYRQDTGVFNAKTT